MQGILRVAAWLFLAFLAIAVPSMLLWGPLGLLAAIAIMTPITVLAAVVVLIVKIAQAAK